MSDPAPPRRYRELEDHNARLLDTVKYLTDENERLQRQLDALKAPEGEASEPEREAQA